MKKLQLTKKDFYSYQRVRSAGGFNFLYALKTVIFFAFAFLLASSVFPENHGKTGSTSSSPRAIIEQAHKGVSKLLEGKTVLNDNDRAQMLILIESHTDFDLMSQRVVEPFRDKLSASQQKEFADTFKSLMQSSSVRKLGRYRAIKFDYLGEEVSDNTTIVKTKAYYKDDTLHLDYVFELIGGTPKVVDYVVEDVATIRNYIKQFRLLFRKKSFVEVMNQLRKKIQQYREEEITVKGNDRSNA